MIKIAGRNLLIDFIRGHYLIAIFVDHLTYTTGRNAFVFYNGNGDLWVSAAEGFVFLTGYFIGIIYHPKFISNSAKEAVTKLIKRTANLYVLSVFLTILYASWALKLGQVVHTYTVFDLQSIAGIVVEALLFKFFYGWADLLALYVVFLAVSPLILWLFARKAAWFVLFASLVLWSLNLGRLDCTRFCVSSFNLASWQLLYILGIFFGSRKDFFRAKFLSVGLKAKILMMIFFVVTLVLSIAHVFFDVLPGELATPVARLFGKVNLGVGRLALFFLWYGALYVLVRSCFKFLFKYLGWLYIFLGQNSLKTYVLQSAVLFLIFYLPFKFSYLSATIATLVLILFIWVVLYLYVKVVGRVKQARTSILS